MLHPCIDVCQIRGVSKHKLPVVDAGAEACCAPLMSEPLSAAEAQELAPLFKAIADPGAS